MPIDDPNTWLQGATALKAGFDAFRSAIRLVRETLGGDDKVRTKAVDEALDHAERAAGIAEAEIAKALGYELCKCEFPPTPMLTVGFRGKENRGSEPIFECPKCGYISVGPWQYTRLAPVRSPETPGVSRF
jgi:hypothetical protein